MHNWWSFWQCKNLNLIYWYLTITITMLYFRISLKIRNEEVSEEIFLFKNINYSPFPGDNILSHTNSLPTVPSHISKLRENVHCSAHKMRSKSESCWNILAVRLHLVPEVKSVTDKGYQAIVAFMSALSLTEAGLYGFLLGLSTWLIIIQRPWMIWYDMNAFYSSFP